MITAYSVLLYIVLAIFLFCYFIATKVWIDVNKKNKELSLKTKKDTGDRRDFLYISSISIGAIGSAVFIWPFIKSMNPAEDTLALGSTEVDLSDINIGQGKTVKWRGKPVFIRKRTQQEINEAKKCRYISAT